MERAKRTINGGQTTGGRLMNGNRKRAKKNEKEEQCNEDKGRLEEKLRRYGNEIRKEERGTERRTENR